jgi:hypothetical protein
LHLPAPASLKPAGEQVFTEGTTTFVPLYRMGNDRYTSYFSRA